MEYINNKWNNHRRQRFFQILITCTLVLDGVSDFILLIDVVPAEVLFVTFSSVSTFSSEVDASEGFAGAVAGSAGIDLGESVL